MKTNDNVCLCVCVWGGGGGVSHAANMVVKSVNDEMAKITRKTASATLERPKPSAQASA